MLTAQLLGQVTTRGTMIHLEPMIWTLRAAENFKNYGDDFDFVCTVTKIGPKACRITGALGKIPKEKEVKYARAVMAELAKLGFIEVVWERAKDL